MDIACLMLDVDGVLVTGRPEDGLFWTHGLEADLGIAPEALQRHLFVPHWTEIVTGRRDLRTVLASVIPRLSETVSTEAFLDYWFAQDSRVEADVLDDCDRLRAAGIAVHLATNQEPLRAAWLMDRLGAHVDGIIHSAAMGAQKPDAVFFAGAARITGHPPDTICLVDDTPANVDSARAAGWRAVLWDGRAGLWDVVARA